MTIRRGLRAEVQLGMSMLGVLGLCLVGGCGAPVEAVAQGAALTASDKDNPNPALFEKDSHPFGLSMETWSEIFARWVWSVPESKNPNFNTAGDCSANQDGPVFFLPFVPSGATNIVSCSVPAHKAIALNLVSILNDYPCPDPTFKPAPGQTLFDFLALGAKQGIDAVAEIDVALDGHPLTDVMSYRVASDDLMYFKGDVSLQQIDNCITGSWQPAAANSYFMMVKPLPPGPHTFTLRYVSTTGKITGPRDKNFTVLADD